MVCLLSTKDTKRHEENHVFFIHEGHERHEEKILRKIGRDRLPRLHGRCGAVVMG
jgi:predicted secreted Zn-dependent protease